MPEISRFLGISIRMYRDEHLPPHFHAIYNEFTAQISIRNPAIINGKLPPRAWLCDRMGRAPRSRIDAMLGSCTH
jgi:hypothetical protein